MVVSAKFAGAVPDPLVFPEFDENLREAFAKETEMFVESLLREDTSVLDLLGADYTFVNERLARHYGIEGIYGSHFRRVSLARIWLNAEVVFLDMEVF
ncbi:MAG: hypothetical protein Ct9H300mP25_09800 [Acidobacteriota bacterium]|nr:MAG: hypothetical protein Ct9H300mP25_09800 [Acidobacteriota bacterium]